MPGGRGFEFRNVVSESRLGPSLWLAGHGVLSAEHPASIHCLRGVRVNGRERKDIVAIRLADGKVEELIPDPKATGDYKVEWLEMRPGDDGSRVSTRLARRWRSTSSVAIDWKPGHGPGSSCDWCSGFFEL